MKIEMAMADLDEKDVEAVADVVRSKRLALGPKTAELEKLFCEKFGVKHAIAVNSGTSGLHLIVKSLGLKEGDEVLVPSYTFVASVNALLFERVTPVFVDVESKTYCFDVKDAEKKITPKTKAIMVVDVFGHPCDWDAIEAFAKKHNLKVIDDCCEALGAKYKDKFLGSLGDAGCFAFYPNKQMTTGEGGMIVTNDDKIAEMCRCYRNQGRGAMSAWLEHDFLGYNYRLDEMSAALGCTQMAKLDYLLDGRASVAQEYLKAFAGHPEIKTQEILPKSHMSWFVFVVQLPKEANREEIMFDLEKRGIPSRAYFSPVHTQKYMKEMFPDLKVSLPVTMEISQKTMALPFHNQMTQEEIHYVAKNVIELVAQFKLKKVAA